tara:strand:- start:1320 stop:1718 length:399 start_codon:yes stop_codon:yes gene_type:complete
MMPVRKKVVLYEDGQMIDNKWTTDLSRREFKPSVMTLFDIVKAYDKLKDGDARAPVVMPYPTQFLVQELGELYMRAEEIATQIKNAARNPLIKGNEDALKGCKKALNQTVVIRKAIKKLARYLDQAVIDDSE